MRSGKDQQGNKKTYHEASIDANRQTEASEHEHRLPITFTKYRLRPKTDQRASTVQHTESQRPEQDVLVGETGLHQVTNDNATDGISIDQTNVQSKHNGVVLQYSRVQVQVSGDKSPDRYQGQEATQRRNGVLTTLATHLHHMQNTRTGGKEKHNRAVHQVPLRKRHLINLLRDEAGLGHADCLQHRLVPEATTTHVGSECVDDADGENALDRARDNAQSQDLSIVFVPGLHVESHG